MNRAIARLAQNNPQAALVDLQHIEEDAERLPRIHFLQEQAYRLLGDPAKANESMAAGLRCEPTEGHGYIARADARLRLQPVDAEGALWICSKPQKCCQHERRYL